MKLLVRTGSGYDAATGKGNRTPSYTAGAAVHTIGAFGDVPEYCITGYQPCRVVGFTAVPECGAEIGGPSPPCLRD
jgi:hypothetical protein